MMISSAQVQSLLKTYGKQEVKSGSADKAGRKAASGQKFDQMLVSEQAKAFQVAKQAMSTVPDIREEKVAALQQAVQTGTYEVSNNEIAEKILNRSIVDILVK